MKTEVIKINPQNIDLWYGISKHQIPLKIAPKLLPKAKCPKGAIFLEKIKKAAVVIKEGGIVAFPTETVYGLAADFLNKQAVNRVFEVKKRPKDKPLTVQLHDITYLEELATDIPAFAYQLMSKFWPGPLTLVFKAKQNKTVGVRIPDNKIAQSLIKMSETPLVVPSANLSGEPAAKTAEEVLQTFDGLIEMVIDGGGVELGVASTVVDLSVSPYRILREGAINQKDIQDAQG